MFQILLSFPCVLQVCASQALYALLVYASQSRCRQALLTGEETEVQRLAITCSFKGTYQELTPFILPALALNHYPLLSRRTPGHKATELLLKIKPKAKSECFLHKINHAQNTPLAISSMQISTLNLLQHLAPPGFSQADRS